MIYHGLEHRQMPILLSQQTTKKETKKLHDFMKYKPYKAIVVLVMGSIEPLCYLLV